MDEDDFEQNRRPWDDRRPGSPHAESETDDVGHRIRASLAARTRTFEANPTDTVDPTGGANRPGIVWVRASDLLNTGTGRVAGRGLDLEAELARRLRRAPATTKRAIRERAAKLPPLSEFGRTQERTHFTRPGLGRR
ncbi:hypothetical protein [Agromyces sp. NPDC058104]|uniref:hypothetical protein n=1 Tax=Agromyces sp. NPDC058104 TaxID=3346342 RepID=UPI0036D7BB35